MWRPINGDGILEYLGRGELLLTGNTGEAIAGVHFEGLAKSSGMAVDLLMLLKA